MMDRPPYMVRTVVGHEPVKSTTCDERNVERNTVTCSSPESRE
jgi:hypothetical protein